MRTKAQIYDNNNNNNLRKTTFHRSMCTRDTSQNTKNRPHLEKFVSKLALPVFKSGTILSSTRITNCWTNEVVKCLNCTCNCSTIPS